MLKKSQEGVLYLCYILTETPSHRLHTPLNFSLDYNSKTSKVSHLLQFRWPKPDPDFDGM